MQQGMAHRLQPVERYFCEAVRRYRLLKRMKVKEAARLAGIPAVSYSCLEAGRYRISLEGLVRISAALGVEFAALWPSEAGIPALPVRHDSLQAAAESARALLPRLVTVEEVVAAVIEAFGIDERSFMSRARGRGLAAARECAAALVNERPHLTLTELGRVMGCEPSVLSHRCKRLAQRGDPEVGRLLQAAREMLAHADGLQE